MKENFQIHIWLGLLLCLLGMSCSDDTPAKGNEPGNGNTELEVNEWIESVMRSDYLWNNDIPAQNKLDFSADPQTFFRSMLSLKDGKTRNGKHLYYYSYMEKNKDYKARTSIDADDTYGMEFTLFNVVNDSNQPLGYYYARILYVLPNSPASSAGLERGDWIVGIKGKNNINSDNYGILLNGDRTQWLVKRGDTEVRTIDIEASAFAQGNGIAGITEATSMVTSYFDPGTKLIYAIGAVVGLIGGVKVYGKFSSGDPDTSKTAASWFGACIFLIVAATILRSFFL